MHTLAYVFRLLELFSMYVYTAYIRGHITWKCYILSCIISEHRDSLLLPHVMSCVHTSTMLLVKPYVIRDLQCPLYATHVETTIATTPNWMSGNDLVTLCMDHNHSHMCRHYNYLHLNHMGYCSGQCTTRSRRCEATVLLLHWVLYPHLYVLGGAYSLYDILYKRKLKPTTGGTEISTN